MKVTGNYTYNGFVIGGASSGYGWHTQGYGTLTYTATRKDKMVYFTNLRLRFRGYNSSDSLSVAVSTTIRNQNLYPLSHGYFTAQPDSSIYQDADITMQDFSYNAGTANTITLKSEGMQRLQGESSWTVLGRADMVLTVPAYTPPTYGSVNGQSKFIDTLYVSVNGKSKKLKKLYGSVNGKSKRIY